MDLKLFSADRAKKRYVAIALMSAIFAYGVWRVFFDKTLADWKEPEKYLGNILWIIAALVFPLMAAIGLYRGKKGGVQAVSLWLLFSTVALEFGLISYGPTFFFPKAWWGVAAVLVLFFLVGPRDLWQSFWIRLPGTKSITPLWLEKAFFGLVWLLLLSAPSAIYVYFGARMGFTYPAFAPLPKEESDTTIGVSPSLPFGFQMRLPSQPDQTWVYPKDNSLNMYMGKHLWTFESKNLFQNSLATFTDSNRKFFAERYGMIPKVIKSMDFGDKPDYFFELNQNGLWGAVAIRQSYKKDPVSVLVYLWDDKGTPLGRIEGFADSLAQKDWNWVYTLKKSEPPAWTPDQYAQAAKKCDLLGQTGQAEFYLASAAIVDPDKPPRLKSLIGYFQEKGFIQKAQSQLKEALEIYSQAGILKSMKIIEKRK
jgi:hypothetical protein